MSKQPKPVIFLAFANDRAEGLGYLRNLPDEARRLLAALEGERQAGLCEVVIRQNATLGDLLAVFQQRDYRNRIGIFHYGGHANGYQLLLERADGQPAVTDAGSVAAFLSQQQGLELVFLNGCSTQAQVQGLLDAGVATVIATAQAIDDRVATLFAERFYQSLASGVTVAQAYHEATAALRAEQGGNTRHLYVADTNPALATDAAQPERWPWQLSQRAGAEVAGQWSLPQAARNPLFGLPALLLLDLPEQPFRHLNWFRREDAPIFFGRGYQIRDLYSRITDREGAPLLLFYGQSGVGKSSLLAAGLLPRLETTHTVCYQRRVREEGLLGALTAAIGVSSAPTSADELRATWLGVEAARQQPLVIIIDQVEELYTRPNPADPDEWPAFLVLLQGLFREPSRRPQGKLILSFRKEWLAEIEKQLVEQKLPRSKVFLERLDRAGILEAIEGITQDQRLLRYYGVTIEEGLAAEIADDLLVDPGAAVAPTLQILLAKLWERARQSNDAQLRFTQELYHALRSQGLLLRDFLDQQLLILAQTIPTAVHSGLALDLLAFHTTALGTAEEHTRAELTARYQHQAPLLTPLINCCQEFYLLTDPAAHQLSAAPASRLAHDTLAPLVRVRFEQSDAAGQRARRILENRAVDWQGGRTGALFDETDLQLVEAGLAGMRMLSADEERLLIESRKAREQREAEQQRLAEEARATRERELQMERRSRRQSQVIAGIASLVALTLLVYFAYPTVVSWRTRGPLVNINAGTAVLGTDNPAALANQQPQILVPVAAYAIEQYEVTNAQYRRCVEVSRCSPPADFQRIYSDTLAADPVVDITALQAADYCRWLGRRLPTEVEWEYAARGAEGRLWPWGNEPPTAEQVQMPLPAADFWPQGTQPVTAMAASATVVGNIYHLAGNVWEWTASYPTDSYQDYGSGRAWDSQNAATLAEPMLILRGGGWDRGIAQITERIIYPANKHTVYYGFRCAQ